MSDSAPAPRHPLRIALIVLGAIALLLALIIAGGFLWLGSPAALRLAVSELEQRTHGAVTVRDARGSLLSSITAAEIAYNDPEKRVNARDVTFAWSPLALLHREFHVRDLAAREIDVVLGKSGESKMPQSLALPISVEIEHASTALLNLRSGAAQWLVRDIRFAYSGGPERHRLSDIALIAEQGSVKGTFAIAARRPYALEGRFTAIGTQELKSPTAEVDVGGNLEHVDIRGRGAIVDATVDAQVVLEPIADVPLKRLAVTLRNLDLKRVASNWPATNLALALEGAPVPDAILAGRFDAKNDAGGPIDRDRIPVRALAGSFRLSEAQLALSGLSGTIGNTGRVAGSAALPLNEGKPDIAAGSEWSLRVAQLDLAAIHTKLLATHLSGDINAALERNVERFDGHLAQDDLALDARGSIAGTMVNLERFTARAGPSELQGRGRFDWSGARRFDIDATAKALDPARFADVSHASLDGTLAATGHLQPGWNVQGTVVLAATSRYQGTPLSGRIAGQFARDRVQDLIGDVRVASAHVQANGALGRTGDRMSFAIDAPRIQDLALLHDHVLPSDARGSVRADGTLSGAFDGLGVDVVAHGASLAFAGASASRIDLKASIAPGSGYSAAALRSRPINIDVAAAGVTWQERTFSRVDGAVTGTLAQHALRVAAKDTDIDVTLAANGGLAPMGSWSAQSLAWSGTITSVENRGTYAVRLTQPAHFDASRTRVMLANAHLALSAGRIDVATFDWNSGRITTRGDFAGLPLAAIVKITGSELPVRSTLVLAGEWNVAATPRLNGMISIRRESGDVYADTTGVLDAGEVAFGVTDLSLTANFVDDIVNARALLKAARLGDASADVTLARVAGAPPGRLSPAAPLSGTVRVDVASLRPLQPFLGTTAVVDGQLHAELALAGTAMQPRATGNIIATGLRFDAPQYGLNWRDGTLRAHADSDVIRIDEFSVAGGDGRFTVTGTVPFAALGRAGATDRTARLVWEARDFRATNRPDLRLITTGDGSVGLAHGRISLRGNLRINEGHVEWRDTRGAKLGDDVVVVGRPRPTARRRFEDLPLDLDLAVDLGTRFSVEGSGLSSNLEGQARFTTTAAGTLTARGTLRTSHGTYEAFGQRLSIERGNLVFDGPIDNPTLDILALRKNLPVEVGVELTGTARLPNVRLTSNPPLQEGEKLSWLVLGQGLERTSGTDIAALQAAAAALFGSTGPGIGTRIARRLGLDDLAIRSTSTAGASGSGTDTRVLAFSKRLTDRLYLVYQAGLSMANNALQLEYALSRSFTLRAQAGQVSSIGIYFLRAFR